VGKIHENGRSDLEDLALPNRSPREADEIGRRVCLRSSGQWIPKTRHFCPYENLGGGTAALSPFQRSPHFAYDSLPPLLGQDLNSCPATKGAYPLGIPTDLCPLNRPQIRQKWLGFRLRSPHLSGEEPCPLRLQTVFSSTPLRLFSEGERTGA